MKFSKKADQLLELVNDTTKLGDLRNLAKDIKKDHPLAMELWASGKFMPRMLSMLIMDKKSLTAELVDKLEVAICKHQPDERNQLMDWLMANQLSKEKKLITLMESWENDPSPMKRRTFWYYQGRLRWVGQVPPPNTEKLLKALEKNMEEEKPEVQWAMNFTAAQIGIFQQEYRDRCIALGKRLELYKDDFVPKGCTPNYLPELIAIQVKKIKPKS